MSKVTNAREETLERLSDFRSTLIDFAKRVTDMVDEFDPDQWEFAADGADYQDVDGFHMSLQTEMTSLDTDYEDLKTTVFDLESELTTWQDLIEEELDNKDEAEMEAADSNYQRDK